MLKLPTRVNSYIEDYGSVLSEHLQEVAGAMKGFCLHVLVDADLTGKYKERAILTTARFLATFTDYQKIIRFSK